MITIHENKLLMGFTLGEAMRLHKELGALLATDFINDKPILAEIYNLLCAQLGFDANV